MPYVGRGGAGNISVVSQENERISRDLEANQASAESESQGTFINSRQPHAYAGRGGAGNHYQSKEISEGKLYEDNERDQGKGDGVNTLGSGPIQVANVSKGSAPGRPGTYGRGGAGNYAYDSSESGERAVRMKMNEEEHKRQELKAEVERGVKDTLAMPPKAKLAGAQPY